MFGLPEIQDTRTGVALHSIENLCEVHNHAASNRPLLDRRLYSVRTILYANIRLDDCKFRHSFSDELLVCLCATL